MRVWHYDGESGIRYTPEIVPDGDQFRLRLDDGLGPPHAWHDLVFISATENTSIYGSKARRGWRLGLDHPVPAEIAARLPKAEKYGGWIDWFGLWPATGVFLTLSAVALFIGLKMPDLLAPLVPQSLERKLGDAIIGDFGGRVCEGPGSQAALATLARRVEPAIGDIKLRVVNIGMVNAVALPGGNVFVFRGLLEDAKSPDELAGVIGHEIGHVKNRDVMQALLRQLGLSVLLGGANANAAGGFNALISSSYSRDAETKADAYSIAALKAAQVSPFATADFFQRLAQQEAALGKAGKALSYVGSHPMSEKREQAFRVSAAKSIAYRPALTPGEWRSIIDACKNDPDVEKDDGFLL
jgi:beta-barrel assembly-enhancing protease